MRNTIKERVRKRLSPAPQEVWARYEESFRRTAKKIASVPVAQKRHKQPQVQTEKVV